MASLEELSLENCKITDIGEAAFSGAPKLKRLSLAGNAISSFNSNPFVNATSLVSVDLSRNQLQKTAWDDGPLFNSSPHLVNLNLANNRIFSVTPNMIEDFVNFTDLDLLGNHLDCDCNLLPLRTYALAHEDQQGNELLIKADNCLAPDEWRFTPVTSYLVSMDADDCVNNSAITDDPLASATKPYVVVLYVVIPFILLFLIIGYGLYRARWVIRSYMFHKQLSSQTGLNAAGSGEFNYDAFVSYSNEDQGFVAKMVAMMENHPPNYKLCVYERDFTAGNVINDCIATSIATSRKVVLIISRHFIQSQWCLWELHLAQHSLLEEQRNGLVLVVVGQDKIKKLQLPPTLRYLMRTRIYLEWDANDQSKQKIFWERLRAALASSPSAISSSSSSSS